MPNVDNMLKFASENGAYMFALTQLQVTNILVAYLCFKHVDRMSEMFTSQLKMLSGIVQDLECKIKQLDQRIETISRLTRGDTYVNTSSDDNCPKRDTAGNSTPKDKKGSKTGRRGKA